ncbi:MAG: hypothetical protein ACM359_18715 [Bacillota bacterium]
MNQYFRSFLISSFVLSFALSTAYGQGTGNANGRPQPIPLQLKVASAPDVAIINATVAANVELVLSDSAVAQQEARRSLENDARTPTAPSPAYVKCYAEAMAKALDPAKISQATVRAQLNAAIALARVAEALKTGQLEPAVLVFLNEKQPYVLQLWGVRAAKFVVADLAKTNASKKVTDAVVAVTKKHLTGAMAAEAYESLQVANAKVLDILLDLLAFRTQLYKKGLPEDPNSEAIPFRFLVQEATWRVVTPEQRQKVFQAYCDLLVLGTYHHDAQPMGSAQREQLLFLVDNLLQSLQVAANRIGDPALAKAAEDASKGRMGTINLGDLVRPVITALTKVKNTTVVEPKLTPPPSTQPVTSAN